MSDEIKKDSSTNNSANNEKAKDGRLDWQTISLMLDKEERKTPFEEQLEKSINNIIEQTKDSIPLQSCEYVENITEKETNENSEGKTKVKDQYGNSLLSIGTQEITKDFTTISWQNDTLNWSLWLALYNDSWVFKRAIDKPAQDMVRCGIELNLNNEAKPKILKELRTHQFDFIKLLQWGNLFGGSIAVMLFDNIKEDKQYAEPIKEDILKNYKHIRFYVVDRWYGVAPSLDDIVDDMDNFDYGKPKYYNVTFADGKTLKVHHDYVLRFEGRTAPQLIKMGQLQGWGYAEGAHIFNEMMRDEKLKTSIQSLIDKSLIEVIKMSGMRGLFMGTDTANEQQIRKRLEMVNWGRNFNSLTFLDKGDEYEMKGFSGLTGLADILQQNMWMIAAALDMQGVLFGDLKSGLSNDTDALERYDNTINGRCENYLRPIYEKFLSYIFKHYGVQDDLDFYFKSLIQDKHDEDKMKALNDFIETCSKLYADGILTPEMYANALLNYTTKGIVDFGINAESIKKIEENVAEQMENINIEGEEEKENATNLGNAEKSDTGEIRLRR